MSPWQLDAAVVPVTGAASGIGLAICRALRAAGATPLLLDVNGDALRDAVQSVYPEAGGTAQRYGYQLDVRDARAVEACLESIGRDHGGATHAVANAGISTAGGLLDISDDDWLRIIDINLHGVLYFCRAAGRQLAQRKGGAIVTTGSIAGLGAREARVGYTASKAAVLNLTRAMALDLGSMGVRVNAVAPGIIDTPMMQRNPPAVIQARAELSALGRLGTAGEVADAVLFLLSGRSSYISGHVLVVDGGLTAKFW